jgi:hypothetical protein
LAAQAKDIVSKLVKLFMSNPREGKVLAEKFGLWEKLSTTVLKPIHMRLCRLDVNWFTEYTQQDPETLLYLKQQPFHKEWQELISEEDRVLIAAPRGHGKSVQLVSRLIWELGNNHNLRIKIIGSSDDKSKEILGLARELISKSPRVQEVFPDLVVDTDRGDTQTKFFVVRDIPQRDPSVEASGVLSTGAGGRADLLVCDDVVDLKNSVINPAQREQVIKAIKDTWFSLVASTGKIVWICTPYHIADCTHDLKNTGAFKVWWTPAIRYQIIYDAEGNTIEDPVTGTAKVEKTILWPDKWSEEKLESRRQELGDRAFTRQYLLNAMSDEERTFPESSLARSFDTTLADIGDGIRDHWPTYGGVDLASALGKKNAYSVVWTIAKCPENGKLYLKELWRKRIQFNGIMDEVKRQCKVHHWRLAYVENNAFQQAVIDALEADDKSLPIQGFTTGAYNKKHEEVGLPGLNIAFEKGFFAVPAAKFPLAPDDTSLLGIFMGELRAHPGGEFSDTIMALWFAYRAAIEFGSDFEDSYCEAVEAA